MRIDLRRRTAVPWWGEALAPLVAFAVTLVIGAVMFAASGKPPVAALTAYFIEPLSEIWSLHELAIKAAPLIIIAVGLSVAYRSNNWNIGAEGQFVAGAITGAALPVLFPGATGVWLLPAMLFLGILGGAAWAAIPGLLKTRFGANEILVSLMLVYVAQLLLDWLVRGPWRNPEGYNFPETRFFGDDARLPEIVSQGDWGGRANWGIVIALALAVVTWIMLTRTLRGFQIKITGASPRAARFAGFDQNATTMFAFLFSGALAGLAGTIEVAGAIGQLTPVISPGYGFTAIIVAFLGRLHPIGIVVAGTLLALTYLGGEAAQISLGVSEKIAQVFQGVLLFAVLASDTFVRYRVTIVTARKGHPA
ncbi:ABC transporter permease [Acuticoccus sp. I52.16.1]|uniref:ABC transporter permease n=1 Tax=Acuticoccus sp. I52.16.1 TaxID=2928472 RepID=UPI001FD22363|nr:ABC transporter permease [Acuticoccus sp. I52.16.1]UOM33145.1 ABC transporter permease [Acuticoccus sp. I52.16.1]